MPRKSGANTVPPKDMPIITGDTLAGVSFAIAHGFAEGKLISRKLRSHLENLGMEEAPANQADVIVSHSGGVYVLPKHASAKLYIHINPSNVPLHKLFRLHFGKIQYDYRLHRQQHQLRSFFGGLASNALYMVKLPHSLRMLRNFLSQRHMLHLPNGGRHIFIRNHIDTFCDTTLLITSTATEHSYLTLPGHHDDCWREPQPYAQVVQALYR